MATKKQEPQKLTAIDYKIKMVVEIEGSIESDASLMEDTGIKPYIDWAVEDIEKALDGICTVVGVKAVELKEIDNTKQK